VSGRTAVVTGSASGIGAAIARKLAAEGFAVVELDLAAKPACDVRDEASIAAALAPYPRLDAVINSAGIAVRHTVEEEDASTWDRIQQVNVRGSFLVSKHALPKMASGGSIVHIASVVGIVGFRERAAYTASKGAIVALTRNMALDCAGRGIRVNCICPGFVETPLIGPILRNPERASRLAALHPLGRLGRPEDIANMAAFLVSDQASWITGQAFAVDGGLSAGHAQIL
jgi:NAD(P)-dependent dehydrogenase (short-subunit alcohol dehydrogenase family)